MDYEDLTKEGPARVNFLALEMGERWERNKIGKVY